MISIGAHANTAEPDCANGGKSLLCQVAATAMHGTAVVISPLISLMKDQVDAAVENGIQAASPEDEEESHSEERVSEKR